jgi:ribonuclease Z
MKLTMNELGDPSSPYVDPRVNITPIPLSLPPPSPSPSIPRSAPAAAFSLSETISHGPITKVSEEESLEYKKNIVGQMFELGGCREDKDGNTVLGQFGDDMAKRHGELLRSTLPPTQPHDILVAYLVRNRDRRGKFSDDKAMAMGVPPGPLFGALARGEDIILETVNESGEKVMKMVKSEDVVGNPISGRSILILDVPGIPYVRKVLENDTLNSEAAKSVDIVVHMLADDVVDDPEYINWMKSFKKSSTVSHREGSV